IGSRKLPDRSIKLLVALISAAVRRDLATARSVLAPHASFGRPDPREHDAWPIAGDADLEALLINLEAVAARLPADAARSCPPLTPAQVELVDRGQAPYWCSYQSSDGLDVLAFRLRTIEGVGYVDYVGMNETKPGAPISFDGEPPAPSLAPTPSVGADTPPPTRTTARPTGAPVATPPPVEAP
ncbi:MAG: hypothetical protein K0V04_37710, partial [Deltaproteobacteria bacterium]|nr:hypothetical protein [Deltaproteobacteria bacterium]